MNEILAELELRRRDFHNFLRQTTPDFIDGWFFHVLCKKLTEFMLAVRAGTRPRLILSVPPRHGKSQTCAVRFPLWCLLNNPDWEIVVASYGQELAERFSRHARALLPHDYIRSLWKINPDPKHSAVREWKLNHGKPFGTYKAVGRGGALTGAGAHVLCIDDALKDTQEADSLTIRENLWDWYCGVARTRLAPGGGILVIQTRWHVDDLVGRLIREQANDKAEQWDVLQFQAIAENDEPQRKAGEPLHVERFSLQELEAARASMAPRLWEALFQQRPTQPGGNIVKDDWIKTYNVDELSLSECDEVIQVWDLRFGKSQAKTSSYVVGQVWARKGANAFLVDQLRGRWDYAESREMVRVLSARYPEALAKLVENKANGPALESDLQDEIPGLILVDPRGDKIQRLERVIPLFRAGNVHVPRTPWLNDYKRELTAFPDGENDDQVDCTSMALGWFHEKTKDVDDVLLLNF